MAAGGRMIASSHLGAIRFRLVVPCGLWLPELRHVEAIWLARAASVLRRQDVAPGFQVVCSGVAAAWRCSIPEEAGAQPAFSSPIKATDRAVIGTVWTVRSPTYWSIPLTIGKVNNGTIFELGYCHFQIRPPRVETGQHRPCKKNILRTENKGGTSSHRQPNP
jgi:hypothetical protein